MTGITDENGEPMVFKSKAPLFKKGKEMSRGDFFAFVVESMARVYESQGMTIKNVNVHIGEDYPHFWMESRNGKRYYVFVNAFLFPELSGASGNDIRFKRFSELARQHDALPAIANVGAFCFETNGSPAIYGGSFALKFTGLEVVSV